MKYLSSPRRVAQEVKSLRLRTKSSIISLVVYIATFMSMLSPFFVPGAANATVTEGFVRFDRLAAGSVLTGTACLKSTLTTQSATVIVFPAGWTIDQTASHWTISTTNLPYDPEDTATQATAWPGIATATSVDGSSVSFPTTSFSAGTFYCFNFDGQGGGGTTSVVGSAGNDQTGQLKTEGGAPYTDSINYAASIVSATGPADQIVVTASVSATMTFSLSATTLSLGTLPTNTPSASAAATQTVSTNARNGWISWVKDSNAGLTSAAAGSTITSPGSYGTITDLASTTGYGLEVQAVAGSPIPAEGYWAGGSANKIGHLDSTQFNSTAQDLSGPAASDQISLNLHAKIPTTQPAATDYTDTLTVVAAGSF